VFFFDNANDWMNNPCPEGWRLPTFTEYYAVLNGINFPTEVGPTYHNVLTMLPDFALNTWKI
jgi:hypothetical protein